MQGIYYLLSIVAVFIVFIWYIRNDRSAEGEPTRGLLAMKEPEPVERANSVQSGGKRVRRHKFSLRDRNH